MNRRVLHRFENFPVHGLLNKVKHVSLVNVVSPHNFTLNLEEFSGQLGKLTEEINRWSSTLASRNATLFDFSWGTPCLARYSVDNIWYRARVNYFVPTNGTVSVYFVDFGNEDFVPKSDLRMLPPNFAKLPIQAINSRLCGADFPPNYDKWPSESMEVMQQFLYKFLRADFIAYDETKNRYEVDLFYSNSKIDHQLSMLNRLVDLNLATSNLEYDHNTGVEDDYENAIYLRNGFIRPQLKIFDKYSADSNKEYSVDLVKYHNIEKFYLTICDNYDIGLEIDKCLLSLYKISDVDEIPRLNFKRYRLGVGCIAKIRNSFYRCEILDFNLKRKLKAGIDDENIIESILDLFGVDTGEVYENIPGDKVFVVADEPTLTMTPHMVICCSLKGIKSTGYSPDDDVVMNKFENFIQRRKCRFMDYVDNNYQVEFLMAKGDSLGDHLVALRVALYREFQVRRKAKRHHILKKRQTRSFAKIDGLSTLHIPAVQNGYLDVIIHRIESADCFYVILANMAYRFKDMNEKLMETYDNNAFRCPLLSVAKGRLCVAKRSNIFQYCRAIVIENINDFFVNVYFIDMALSEIVSVANLYLMTEEFALFPPMLFECSLSNVRPSEYLNEKFLEYIANAHDICIRIASINASATVAPLAEEDVFTKCRTEPGLSLAIGAECRLNVLHLSALECQSQQKQMVKKLLRDRNTLDTLGGASELFNDQVHRKKTESSEKYRNVGQKITVTADVQRSSENDDDVSAGLLPVDVDVVNQSLSSGYKSRLIDRIVSSRCSKFMPKRFIEKKIHKDDVPSSSLGDQKNSKRPYRFRTFFTSTLDTLEVSSAFTIDSLPIHHNANDFMESITKECSMADEHRHTFCENGIAVQAEKSVSHRVMFFIHGVGGCMKIWEHQIKYFHSKGYEVIAMDLIGHGRSELPDLKSRYEFKAIKSDVMLIFDKYSSKSRYKNIVMAHSYGTCFAAILSRERPNLIGHLILISCGAPVPLVPDGGVFRLPTVVFQLVRPILNYNFRRLAYHIKPSSKNFRRAFGMVDSKAVRFIMLGQNWPQGDRIYHQQINVPTLLIYGLSDRLVSLDEMNDMRKTIPAAHLEVIEQASHMVMQENADQVNELVDKFLLTDKPDYNGSLCTETSVRAVNKSVDVGGDFKRHKNFLSRHSTGGILSEKSDIAKNNKRPKSSGCKLTACMPTFKVY